MFRGGYQKGQTKKCVDEENNTIIVVRMWLFGGNKEGTRRELLAATYSIKPSNGWNITMTIAKLINHRNWNW